MKATPPNSQPKQPSTDDLARQMEEQTYFLMVHVPPEQIHLVPVQNHIQMMLFH